MAKMDKMTQDFEDNKSCNYILLKIFNYYCIKYILLNFHLLFFMLSKTFGYGVVICKLNISSQ